MLNRPTRTRRNSNSPYIFMFSTLAFFLGLAVGYLIWGGKIAVADSNEPRRVTVSTDDDASLGPADAPITIIEFSDYQCPYCEQWHKQIFDELMAAYPGQIRFVYRDFPLPSHPEAQPAAEAAECAGDQGAYWDFHNALFSGTYGLSRAAYEQYASDLDLDTASFAACLDARTYQNEVQADARDASRAGVNSTPSFVVNGRLLIGALPLSDFKAVIDEELAADR